MKQIGLTLIALILVVGTALPANATVKTKAIAPTTTFTMATIPGGVWCC